MKSNQLKVLSVIVTSFLLTFGFQNCSSPTHVDGMAKVASIDPFPYPYSKRQNFYVNSVILAAESEVASLSQFKVTASAAYADDRNQLINYTVMVKDGNGNVACPTRSGVLNPGQSSIEFDCTSTAVDSALEVTIELTAAGNLESFVFNF